MYFNRCWGDPNPVREIVRRGDADCPRDGIIPNLLQTTRFRYSLLLWAKKKTKMLKFF